MRNFILNKASGMKKATNIQVGKQYIYRSVGNDLQKREYIVTVVEIFDDEVAKVRKAGEICGENVWICNLYEIQ